MTEAEWLGCKDPVKMLGSLRGKASARKLRLFMAHGNVRRVKGFDTDLENPTNFGIGEPLVGAVNGV